MEREAPRPGPETNGQQEPDERTKEAFKALQEGYESYLNEEHVAEYLTAMGTFHTYSPNNVMMILAQRPDATRVAGFGAWRKLDRYVQKGESGIYIWAPRFIKEEDPDTGEDIQKLSGFLPVKVFDVAQTDGKPLPEDPLPQELAGSSDGSKKLARLTADWLTEDGVTVYRSKMPREEMHGSYSPRTREIKVKRGMSDDQTCKTLMHETAHHVAQHDVGLNLQDAETIAEASAFVVLSRYGIDTSGYSFGYIMNWTEDDGEILKKNLQAIRKTSKAIINGIEEHAEKRDEVFAEELPDHVEGNRLVKVEDYTHLYRGYHTEGGKCRIQLYDGGQEPIIVCTELDDNHNTSITNMTEYIAAEVADKYFRGTEHEGAPFIWVEHYPRTTWEKELMKLPPYSLVRFSHYNPHYTVMNGTPRKKLGRPRWTHLDEEDYVKLMDGEQVQELPPPPNWMTPEDFFKG